MLLEMTSVPGLPGPTWAGQGKVVRVTATGGWRRSPAA